MSPYNIMCVNYICTVYKSDYVDLHALQLLLYTWAWICETHDATTTCMDNHKIIMSNCYIHMMVLSCVGIGLKALHYVCHNDDAECVLVLISTVYSTDNIVVCIEKNFRIWSIQIGSIQCSNINIWPIHMAFTDNWEREIETHSTHSTYQIIYKPVVVVQTHNPTRSGISV